MDECRRTILALEVFQTGVWPSEMTEHLQADVAWLREKYSELRLKMNFQEAARIVKAGLVYNLVANAVAAEREACTQVVEQEWDTDYPGILGEIAEAIRNREIKE